MELFSDMIITVSLKETDVLLPSVYHTLCDHVDKGKTKVSTSHYNFHIILGGTKEHMFSSSCQTCMDNICLYHKLELQYVAVYMCNLIVGSLLNLSEIHFISYCNSQYVTTVPYPYLC